MTYRYPLVVGQMLKYILIPIEDDDDVDIMFDAIARHPKLSNIDLYLESEIISSDSGCPSNQCDINFERFCHQEQKNEMDGDFVGRCIDWDAIPSMTGIEDFNCLSQNAMVNNVMLDENDINEKLIDNVLGEEEDIFDANGNSSLTAQLRMPTQDTIMEHEHQTRPSSHSEPLYEAPSLSFTNLEGVDNGKVSS
ncbi:hypothetical protein CRYUN_Cryun28dG0091700 [Craigia yunnanensis]